jgi:Zn-finger nucleic acid-binding protein
MKCPKCAAEVEVREPGGMCVAQCPACRGIWMSEETLRRAKDEAEPDVNWMDFSLWKHRHEFVVGEEAVDCPSCGRPMVALSYGDTGVVVDYCVHCRGVWLDEGELTRIVGSLRRELATMDVPDYVRASLGEAADLVRSEEGLVSDWRDLHTVLRMLKYRIMSRSSGVVKLLADLQQSNPIR